MTVVAAGMSMRAAWGADLQRGVRAEDAVTQLPVLAAPGQGAIPAQQWHAPLIVVLRRCRI